MNQRGLLVVIVGPTAVGKTALSIELAEHFNTEIISADSRQFYREMEIGTAKPSEKELDQIQHHFINSHSISELYGAGQFSKEARIFINSFLKTNPFIIMTGGSGLYVRAVCEGLDDMPEVPLSIREELNQEYLDKGLSELLNELEQKDPKYFDQVDHKNPQRVIRALEIIRAIGKPYSTYRIESPPIENNFDIVTIGLEIDRSDLYKRIDDRMDQMIKQGLFEEAEQLYPHRNNNALQTVGYQEIFAFLENQYDKEEAIRLLKRNSRRYAKRQMTWFKKDQSIEWFNPDQKNEILKLIEDRLK